MDRLSSRYATSLLSLSLERGILDTALEQAAFALETLQVDGCWEVLQHPHISTTEKRQFLNEIFNGRVTDDLLGFFYLVIAKSRERIILPALTEFIRLGKHHNGETEAVVVSAFELSESQISALRNLLSEKLDKRVEISFKTDPALLGGFYILVDGRIIDGTIRKQLNDMKDTIKRGTPDDSQAR